MKKRPQFRSLPAPLQMAIKQAASDIAKRCYTQERDALAALTLEAHRRGEDAHTALVATVHDRMTTQH